MVKWGGLAMCIWDIDFLYNIEIVGLEPTLLTMTLQTLCLVQLSTNCMNVKWVVAMATSHRWLWFYHSSVCPFIHQSVMLSISLSYFSSMSDISEKWWMHLHNYWNIERWYNVHDAHPFHMLISSVILRQNRQK